MFSALELLIMFIEQNRLIILISPHRDMKYFLFDWFDFGKFLD